MEFKHCRERGRMVDRKTAQPHAIGLDGTRTTSKLALNCQYAICYTDF